MAKTKTENYHVDRIPEKATHVGQLLVRDDVFDVYVETVGDDLWFCAQFEDRVYRTRTAKELKEALQRVTKKARTKVSVPFTTLHGSTLQNGVATGIHATTSAILVKYENGDTDQIDFWRDYNVVRRLDPMEAEIWLDIQKATTEAQRRAQEFLEIHQFPKGLRTAVEQAIDDKQNQSR